MCSVEVLLFFSGYARCLGNFSWCNVYQTESQRYGCEVGTVSGQILADPANRNQPLPMHFSPSLLPGPTHRSPGTPTLRQPGELLIPQNSLFCFDLGRLEEDIFRGWPASPCLSSPQRGSGSAPVSPSEPDECWAGELICHEGTSASVYWGQGWRRKRHTPPALPNSPPTCLPGLLLIWAVAFLPNKDLSTFCVPIGFHGFDVKC